MHIYFLGGKKERLKIPNDPRDWSETHVKHWLQWAVRQFNIVSLRLADWNITGAQLCNLTMEEFHAKVPLDPGDVFWTHFELLRKCKFVGMFIKICNILYRIYQKCLLDKAKSLLNFIYSTITCSCCTKRCTGFIK